MLVVLHGDGREERLAEQGVAHFLEGAERALETGIDARGDGETRVVPGERRALVAHLQQTRSDEFAAGRQQLFRSARVHVTKKRDGARHRPAVVDGGVGEVLHLLETRRAREQAEQAPGGVRQAQSLDEAFDVRRHGFRARRFLGRPIEADDDAILVLAPGLLEFGGLVGHVAAERFDERWRQWQAQDIRTLVQPDEEIARGAQRQVLPDEQTCQVARDETALDVGNDAHEVFGPCPPAENR